VEGLGGGFSVEGLVSESLVSIRNGRVLHLALHVVEC